MARDRDSPRQILKGPGFTNVRAGLFTSIPCVFGARAIGGSVMSPVVWATGSGF